MSTSLAAHLSFDSAARYRILVRGQIAPRWADRLEGMSIHFSAQQDEPAITILEGELFDQAALAGVLNTLYDMHLPVLSLECLSAGRQAPSLQSSET